MKNTTHAWATWPWTAILRPAVVTCLVTMFAGSAQADFISVPGQQPTIQDAIAVASDGDTILVSEGLYWGPVRYHGKKITIRGTGNPIFTIIRSYGSAVQFIDGETLDSRIEGFTIVGLGATYGGGVHIVNAACTIANCSITGSALVRGGGINIQWGEAVIENTSSSGSAGVYGGGLSLQESTATLRNCSCSGSAPEGGGIASTDSSLSFDAGLVLGATASKQGAGLLVLRSELDLRNVQIASCSLEGIGSQLGLPSIRGAGLCILESPVPTIENCAFEFNNITNDENPIERGEGGGIYSDNSLHLTEVTFTQNFVTSGGTFVVAKNPVISDGYAAGGAVCSTSGPCSFADCIFSNNILLAEAGALTADGIALGGSIQVAGDALVQKSIITGGTAEASLQSHGGAVEAGSATVTFVASTVNDARAIASASNGVANGGAIRTEGHVSTSQSQFFDCIVQAGLYAAGGTIYAESDVDCDTTWIEGSTATRASTAPPEDVVGGGAIHAGSSAAVLTDSTITDCSSSDWGGAVYARATTLSNTEISYNTAQLEGGGIYGTTVDMEGGRLAGNTTVTAGGGAFVTKTFTANDATISGNTAYGNEPYSNALEVFQGGGGIHALGHVTLNFVEASLNTAYGFLVRRGGLLWSESSVTIRNSFVDGNRVIGSGFGGAVACADAIVAIDSEFRKNIVNAIDTTGLGGAISAATGTIDGCSFFANQVLAQTALGGSIAVTELSGISIRNCAFERDAAAGESAAAGGSIFSPGGTVQILSSTFLDCSCSHDGGALSFMAAEEEGNLLIADSTFESNVADGSGGAVNAQNVTNLEIRDTFFRNNGAAENGGGLFLVLSNTVSDITPLKSCHFDGNSASIGGAFYVNSATSQDIHLESSVLSSNVASVGGGAYIDGLTYLRCQNNTFCANVPNDISGVWADDGGNSLGNESDCNVNGVCDAADIASGWSLDCNANSIPDDCDIASGLSNDNDNDGIPDECSNDCNANGISDAVELASGDALDCNENGTPDECDIADGSSSDYDGNGVPDSCDVDCNNNGIPDVLDVASGSSADCNDNLSPDECDISESGTSADNDENGIPDECDCPGDLNADNIVDGADLTILISNWGAVNSTSDINYDGVVDGLDLTIALATWGPCPSG